MVCIKKKQNIDHIFTLAIKLDVYIVGILKANLGLFPTVVS